MKIEIHLHFNGCCREALEFYTKELGGTEVSLLTYGESPAGEHVPEDQQNWIVHGSMSLGDLVIAGADIMTDYERPAGFNILLQLENEEDSRTKFALLAEGGEVIMPLQSTFWSPSYGIVRDKLGIPWEVNCNPQ